MKLMAIAVCCAVCGCVTKEPPELYNLETAAQMLIVEMSKHSQFTMNYNAVKTAKGKVPVVCLSPVKNNTSLPEGRGWGRNADEFVRIGLFDTGLFEVKNDDDAGAILSRIIWGADGGIENVSEIMKTIGEQDAPDFMVTGDIKPTSPVDGYPAYRLRLAVYDLKTGKVVWEGLQTRVQP